MGVSSFEVKRMPPLPTVQASINDYIDQFEETRSLTAKQKEWFYWTNYSRINPKRFWDSVIAPLLITFPSLDNPYSKSLKKDLYNTPPLPLLKPNSTLMQASYKLAKELADKNADTISYFTLWLNISGKNERSGIKKCAEKTSVSAQIIQHSCLSCFI
jgi:hypothetical protein